MPKSPQQGLPFPLLSTATAAVATVSTKQNCFLAAVGFEPTPPEETGALNQRLRPLGHATFLERAWLGQQRMPPGIFQSDEGTGGKKRGQKSRVAAMPAQECCRDQDSNLGYFGHNEGY